MLQQLWGEAKDKSLVDSTVTPTREGDTNLTLYYPRLIEKIEIQQAKRSSSGYNTCSMGVSKYHSLQKFFIYLL